MTKQKQDFAVGFPSWHSPIRRAFREVVLEQDRNVFDAYISLIRVPTIDLDEEYMRKLGIWYHLSMGKGYPTALSRLDRDIAYDAFKEDILHQWDVLVENGIRIVLSDEDPYRDAKHLVGSVRQYDEIEVRGTRAHNDLTVEHPLYILADRRDANAQEVCFNDVFRAVHDLMSHCLLGADIAPFDYLGEYRSSCAHAIVFREESLPALATEAVGAIAWMYMQDDITTFPPKQICFVPPKFLVNHLTDVTNQNS